MSIHAARPHWLGGAEMWDDADFGIGSADDRDLVLQRFRENSSVHREAKNARDVIVHHLAGVALGNVGEVLCHLFARVRPHAFGMRVVGTPHQVFDADHVASEHAGAVVLESGEELAMEVIARGFQAASVPSNLDDRPTNGPRFRWQQTAR